MAMSFLLSRRILGLPKRLGLASQRAIRMLGVIHPISASEWRGKEFDVPARLPAVQPVFACAAGLLTDQARSGELTPDRMPDTIHPINASWLGEDRTFLPRLRQRRRRFASLLAPWVE
jgi:hypothetical protein